MLDDTTLWSRYCAGDFNALADLMNKHSAWLGKRAQEYAKDAPTIADPAMRELETQLAKADVSRSFDYERFDSWRDWVAECVLWKIILSNHPEKDDWASFRGGDMGALDRLWDKYHNWFMMLAWMQTGKQVSFDNFEDDEGDISSLRIKLNANCIFFSYEAPGSWRKWAGTVLTNIIRDRLRRDGRRHRGTSVDDLEGGLVDVKAQAPRERLLSDESKRLLPVDMADCLSGLSREHREILVLVIVKQWQHQHVAERVYGENNTGNRAKVTREKRKAKEHLKTCLGGKGYTESDT